MLDLRNLDNSSRILALAVIFAMPMLAGCLWWLALRLRFPAKPAIRIAPYLGFVLAALMLAIDTYMAALVPITVAGHPERLWWRLGSLAMLALYGGAFGGLSAYYLQMRRRVLAGRVPPATET